MPYFAPPRVMEDYGWGTFDAKDIAKSYASAPAEYRPQTNLIGNVVFVPYESEYANEPGSLKTKEEYLRYPIQYNAQGVAVVKPLSRTLQAPTEIARLKPYTSSKSKQPRALREDKFIVKAVLR